MQVFFQFGEKVEGQRDGMNKELHHTRVSNNMLHWDKDLLLAIDHIEDGLSHLMKNLLEVVVAERGRVIELGSDDPVEQLGQSVRSDLQVQVKVVEGVAGEELRELLVEAVHAGTSIQYARYNYYLMSIKILLTLTIAALASLAIFHYQHQQQLQEDSFLSFAASFGKQYQAQEIAFRRHIFLKNKAMIERHNSQQDKTYEMGINQFSDLTTQEFKQMYLGILGTEVGNAPKIIEEQSEFEVDIDWRAQGKVTRVKNQGMCASCWAFCVVGAMESAYLIKGVNQQFSEQQLVDCSNSYGNLGCHGGQLEYTFRYIKEKGLNSQASYPYIGKDQNCKKTHGPYKIASYWKGITCTGLYSALKKGPVAVTVEAIYWSFYKNGIFSECGNEVNHGVLVVGATSEYWLVKNSWGAQWGNNGYIKLRRGNTCSVCETPFWAEL